jgi:amino acid transporter
VPSRRRRQVELERVLGTPALFATAYGNVGSSIYYALGLTAVFALGLTPLVFIVAGLIFACTAATYSEGTVRFPEAGGSSRAPIAIFIWVIAIPMKLGPIGEETTATAIALARSARPRSTRCT